jgi:hypothetical protein
MQEKTRPFSLKRALQLCILAFAVSPALSIAQSGLQDTELDQGYRNLYNSNFDSGRANFRTWMQAHPDDPLGPASDAAALLFTEFHRLNIVGTQLFNDPYTDERQRNTKPNPHLRSDFDQRTQQAESLADKILSKSPKDAHALFTKMLIYGLRADYAEMLDKSDFRALQYSKKGANYSALTLQADPNLYDAHIATGFENYMLGTKPAPIRWVARLMGGQTDKEFGISELKLTAAHGRYLAPFAQILLSVAMIRDGNKQEARNILSSLAKEFPENPLYARQLSRIQ